MTDRKYHRDSMADTLSTSSTSTVTAAVNDTVLRTKDRVRLVFRPKLVDNPKNASAAVEGTFIYQRKTKAEVWQDYCNLPLSKLRTGEWIKLNLDTAEVLALFETLSRCYDLYAEHGVPRGHSSFISVPKNEAGKTLIANEGDFAEVLTAHNFELMTRYVKWLANMDPSVASKGLAGVAADELTNFDSMLGVARLRQVLAEIQTNMNNSSEDYWHDLFRRYPWVLSQLFAYPVIAIGDKVYVGGKGIDNHGGNIADFAFKNGLTQNIALVEIKTPTATLLGSKLYRQNAYPVSPEFAGATAQILATRSSLMEEYTSLVAHSEEPYQSW